MLIEYRISVSGGTVTVTQRIEPDSPGSTPVTPTQGNETGKRELPVATQEKTSGKIAAENGAATLSNENATGKEGAQGEPPKIHGAPPESVAPTEGRKENRPGAESIVIFGPVVWVGGRTSGGLGGGGGPKVGTDG